MNRVRRRRGLRPLRTILVPLVLADDLQPITSTRVRAGVIDRHGRRLSPIRLALWSSEKELVRPFRTAVRATFPRGRLSVRTMRPEGSIPPARQVRSWSRAALSGHDLAFAVLVAPGPRRDALFSERSNTVELYPKRLPRSRGLKVRDWTFLLRPRARRQGSGRGAPKG